MSNESVSSEQSRNSAMFDESVRIYSDSLTKEELAHIIINKCTTVEIISGFTHFLNNHMKDSSNQSLHIALLVMLRNIESELLNVLGDGASEVMRIDNKIADVIDVMDKRMNEMNEYEVVD